MAWLTPLQKEFWYIFEEVGREGEDYSRVGMGAVFVREIECITFRLLDVDGRQ